MAAQSGAPHSQKNGVSVCHQEPVKKSRVFLFLSVASRAVASVTAFLGAVSSRGVYQEVKGVYIPKCCIKDCVVSVSAFPASLVWRVVCIDRGGVVEWWCHGVVLLRAAGGPELVCAVAWRVVPVWCVVCGQGEVWHYRGWLVRLGEWRGPPHG